MLRRAVDYPLKVFVGGCEYVHKEFFVILWRHGVHNTPSRLDPLYSVIEAAAFRLAIATQRFRIRHTMKHTK